MKKKKKEVDESKKAILKEKLNASMASIYAKGKK